MPECETDDTTSLLGDCSIHILYGFIRGRSHQTHFSVLRIWLENEKDTTDLARFFNFRCTERNGRNARRVGHISSRKMLVAISKPFKKGASTHEAHSMWSSPNSFLVVNKQELSKFIKLLTVLQLPSSAHLLIQQQKNIYESLRASKVLNLYYQNIRSGALCPKWLKIIRNNKQSPLYWARELLFLFSSKPGMGNFSPGGPLSCRVQLQPQSNTHACSFLVILKTLFSMFMYVWLKLEQNSAGQWPSNDRSAHPCSKQSHWWCKNVKMQYESGQLGELGGGTIVPRLGSRKPCLLFWVVLTISQKWVTHWLTFYELPRARDSARKKFSLLIYWRKKSLTSSVVLRASKLIFFIFEWTILVRVIKMYLFFFLSSVSGVFCSPHISICCFCRLQ